MIVSQYVVWFVVFSLLGWVYESVFCSINRGHWCERGFLFGPLCPIYGTGAVLAIAIFGSPAVESLGLPWWAVFLICAVGASTIEWFTSIAMERAFGTVWWDYSNLPLNLQGRISVPSAAVFGLAGLGVVYIAIPLVRAANAAVPPLAFEIAALVCVAVVAVDATLTVCTLTEVLAVVNQVNDEFNQLMQGAIDAMPEQVEQIRSSMVAVPATLRAGAESVPSTLRAEAERLRENGTGRMQAARASSAAYAERLRELAGGLSERQRHVLHNARRFNDKDAGIAAQKLTEALDSLKSLAEGAHKDGAGMDRTNKDGNR